jgi:hypothetical protein
MVADSEIAISTTELIDSLQIKRIVAGSGRSPWRNRTRPTRVVETDTTTSSARNTRYNVGHRSAAQLLCATLRTFPSQNVVAEPKGSRMNMPREKQATTQEQPIVRFGLGLANWSERWFPDPLIFALLGIVVVFIVGLLLRQSPRPGISSDMECCS